MFKTAVSIPSWNRGVIEASFTGATDENFLCYEAKLCSDSSCVSCSDSIKVEQGKKQSFTDLTHGTMSYLCTRAIDAVDNSSEWLVSAASGADTVL